MLLVKIDFQNLVAECRPVISVLSFTCRQIGSRSAGLEGKFVFFLFAGLYLFRAASIAAVIQHYHLIGDDFGG
jgi:hypothetical protein